MSLNDWLMIATLVAAIATRWWVVAGLAATYCAHSAVDHAGWLDAYGYYLSVVLIDALFALIIHLKSPVSRHLRIAQLICALFIPVQIGGLLMWYLYEPPLVYNVACSVLYLALITTIISRDKSVPEIVKVLGTISSMILIGVMALRWLRKTRLKDDEEDPLECRGDSGADCATGGDVSPKD